MTGSKSMFSVHCWPCSPSLRSAGDKENYEARCRRISAQRIRSRRSLVVRDRCRNPRVPLGRPCASRQQIESPSAAIGADNWTQPRALNPQHWLACLQPVIDRNKRRSAADTFCSDSVIYFRPASVWQNCQASDTLRVATADTYIVSSMIWTTRLSFMDPQNTYIN